MESTGTYESEGQRFQIRKNKQTHKNNSEKKGAQGNMPKLNDKQTNALLQKTQKISQVLEPLYTKEAKQLLSTKSNKNMNLQFQEKQEGGGLQSLFNAYETMVTSNAGIHGGQKQVKKKPSKKDQSLAGLKITLEQEESLRTLNLNDEREKEDSQVAANPPSTRKNKLAQIADLNQHIMDIKHRNSSQKQISASLNNEKTYSKYIPKTDNFPPENSYTIQQTKGNSAGNMKRGKSFEHMDFKKGNCSVKYGQKFDFSNKHLDISDRESQVSNRDIASRETAHFRITFSNQDKFQELAQAQGKKRCNSNPNRNSIYLDEDFFNNDEAFRKPLKIADSNPFVSMKSISMHYQKAIPEFMNQSSSVSRLPQILDKRTPLNSQLYHDQTTDGLRQSLQKLDAVLDVEDQPSSQMQYKQKKKSHFLKRIHFSSKEGDFHQGNGNLQQFGQTFDVQDVLNSYMKFDNAKKKSQTKQNQIINNSKIRTPSEQMHPYYDSTYQNLPELKNQVNLQIQNQNSAHSQPLLKGEGMSVVTSSNSNRSKLSKLSDCIQKKGGVVLKGMSPKSNEKLCLRHFPKDFFSFSSKVEGAQHDQKILPRQ